MNKFARLQAQANAISRGEDAATGTIEMVVLIIAVIVAVGLVFAFIVKKVGGAGLTGVGTAIDNANGYMTGTEIPAVAGK